MACGYAPRCVLAPTRTSTRSTAISWHQIPVTLDAAVLSDDHVARNVMVDSSLARSSGLAAVDLSGYGKEATFDHFDYKEL